MDELLDMVRFLADCPIDVLRCYAGTSETVNSRRIETFGMSRGDMIVIAIESLFPKLFEKENEQ